MTLAHRIVSARKACGLTRPELALLIDMPYQTLAELENGRTRGTRRLGRLAAALGVNALWLETGQGVRNASGAAAAESPTVLTPDERELLIAFRAMPEARRATLSALAAELSGRGGAPAVRRKPRTKRASR